MKSYKMTKKMLKDLHFLLKKVGAVDPKEKQAFPSDVFVSKNTYKQIRKNVRQAFKKEYPYLRSRKLNSAIGMHLLNLGPVELNGVKDGFVLVDNASIEDQIKRPFGE